MHLYEVNALRKSASTNKEKLLCNSLAAWLHHMLLIPAVSFTRDKSLELSCQDLEKMRCLCVCACV